MTGKDSDLPIARTVPGPRAWLKDHAFLMEIGGTVAFLGIFLSMAVIAQRDHAEMAKDPVAAEVFLIFLQIVFLLTTAGGVMAWMQARVGAVPARGFLRYVLEMLCGAVVSCTVVTLIVLGVTSLILPLQMFFAWLALSAGFATILRMRHKMRAAASPPPPNAP